METVKPFIRINGCNEIDYARFANRVGRSMGVLNSVLGVMAPDTVRSDFRLMPSSLMDLSDEELGWMLSIASFQSGITEQYLDWFSAEPELHYVPFCGQFVSQDADEATKDELHAFVKSHQDRCRMLGDHPLAVGMVGVAKSFHNLISSTKEAVE